MIKSKGRMLRRDLSISHKFASLSKDSQVLFCLLIPHFNAHGKMNGEPEYIKGLCAPLIKWLDIKKISKCLLEIGEKTNVKYFKVKEIHYLHCLSWLEHQEIEQKKLGSDDLPSYSITITGQVADKSPTSRRQVVPEVEVKDQDEVKLKLKVEVEGGLGGTKETATHTKKFQKPTLGELQDYCKQIGADIEPQRFLDFYDSKGWVVGKSPMKDWRAAVRTWKGMGRMRDNGSDQNRTGRIHAEADKYARFDK